MAPRVHSVVAVEAALTVATTATVPANGGTLTVDSTTGWPAPGAGEEAVGAIEPQNVGTVEVFSYTGLTATTFTGVTRGISGTTAKVHDIGSKVIHIVDAVDLAQIWAANPALGTGLPVVTSSSASSAGAAGTLTASKSDHRHGFTAGVPVALGDPASAGAASTLSRGDHRHPTTGLITPALAQDFAYPNMLPNSDFSSADLSMLQASGAAVHSHGLGGGRTSDRNALVVTSNDGAVNAITGYPVGTNTPARGVVGRPYTLSAWIYTAVAGREANLTLRTISEDGATSTDITTTTVLTAGDWTRVSATTSSLPRPRMTVRLLVRQTAGAAILPNGESWKVTEFLLEEGLGPNGWRPAIADINRNLVNLNAASTAEKIVRAKRAADTFDLFTIDADGYLRWGAGGTNVDIGLRREAAGLLRATGYLEAEASITAQRGTIRQVTVGDNALPMIEFSPGAGSERRLIYLNGPTPEGVVTANPGSFCMTMAGGYTCAWIKVTGVGSTGWTSLLSRYFSTHTWTIPEISTVPTWPSADAPTPMSYPFDNIGASKVYLRYVMAYSQTANVTFEFRVRRYNVAETAWVTYGPTGMVTTGTPNAYAPLVYVPVDYGNSPSLIRPHVTAVNGIASNVMITLVLEITAGVT